jgi:hypothetical protein
MFSFPNISPLFYTRNTGESQANIIGSYIARAIYGERAFRSGQHRLLYSTMFFNYVAGLYDMDEADLYLFPLFYIDARYGQTINRDFFCAIYANEDNLSAILETADFLKTESERTATLYSYLANDNLAWLYRWAGFQVSDEIVDKGVAYIRSLMPVKPVGDVSSDWAVNYKDLDMMAEQWLKAIPPETALSADLNADKKVDLNDFAALANEWLLAGGYIATSNPGTINLVAYYKFDGNAQDSSGNGNNGTLIGNPMWISAGKVGGALQFNGLDYVECGDGPSLHLTDAVAISAWIKLAGPAADQKIAGNQDGVAGGYKLGVFADKIEFEIRTFDNWAVINRAIGGGTVLAPGVWYYIAGVYSKGSYIATYVNGALDRVLTTSAILGSTTGTFKIGRDPACYGYLWNGIIDDLRVYNKALSPSEIAYLSDETPADGKLYVPK